MDRGTETQIELEKNKVDDAIVENVLSLGSGVNGTFLTTDPYQVTVQDGIVVDISAPPVPLLSKIGVNFCVGAGAPNGEISGAYPGGLYPQVNWNNANYGIGLPPVSGDLIPLAPYVNSNGALVPALTINTTNQMWQMPDNIVGAPKHGGIYVAPGLDNPSAPGDAEYDGCGGDTFPTDIVLTVTNIPYASYKVALLIGWYENSYRWHEFDPANPPTMSGADDWVSNPYSATIVGSTFTFNGGDGHGVAAVQIIEV
jgi:hypothetical protein